MRWVKLSDCGDPSGVTRPSFSFLLWLHTQSLMHFVLRHLWSEVGEEGFHLPPRGSIDYPPCTPLQLLPSPCWRMKKGSPWSWIISGVCFCLREARAWWQQSISLFHSLVFLNLSTSYRNWYQAEQVVHLVTFDTTSAVKGSGTPHSLKPEQLHVFLGAVPGSLHTSLLVSVNVLSPLQVDTIPKLSCQGQWPPPKLAAWAALPQCLSCLPCLCEVLNHALDNAPHPLYPWASEHAAYFGTWHHMHKADLYKLFPMDLNGTGSSPILLAYLLNFCRLSVQTYW